MEHHKYENSIYVLKYKAVYNFLPPFDILLYDRSYDRSAYHKEVASHRVYHR